MRIKTLYTYGYKLAWYTYESLYSYIFKKNRKKTEEKTKKKENQTEQYRKN